MLHAGDDAPRTTLRFLDEQKDILEMRAPLQELTLERAETDTLGMRHVRFRQITHGIPVVGAELATHYDAAGRIAAIDANYVPELDDLDVEPSLGIAESRAIARASVRASDEAKTEAEDLVVFALGEGEPRLAYTHTIRAFDPPALWIVTVDAKSGDDPRSARQPEDHRGELTRHEG